MADKTTPKADETPAPKDTQTKGDTFDKAAQKATPADTSESYVGVSPERERTGRADKGLSQANPAILNGGPVPDPRPGVDDTDALEA